MLRLCQTLLRDILHRKQNVNINVLTSTFMVTYGWVHHGQPYRICCLLPALGHLECIASDHVSSVCGFKMPKTKRKSKHKKSKHSKRKCKKAKYSVPELIEISSSSDTGSDIAIVFDFKEERLRVANENIVDVQDSDNDVKCEKISPIEVNVVNNTEKKSNEDAVVKERETDTADMWNTVWSNAQAVNPANVGIGGAVNVPAGYAYYGHGSIYAQNVPQNVCVYPFAPSAISTCTANVYIPANVQAAAHAFAATESTSYSSTLYGDERAGYAVNNIWNVVEKARISLKKRRHWQRTGLGSSLSGNKSTSASQFVFTVMSYNILAQDLIHQHQYLYKDHYQHALAWEVRSQILMSEIREANAQILCLQEVQQSHLDTLNKQLNELGYKGIYKRRTGNNIDGVAIYYKTDAFELVDYTTVEYFQPNVNRLNRDNVGLVAKLACKIKPNKQLVVATTHLLFNPRRHDVKLSQIQVLLAEVERFAFDNFSHGKPHYWPVIITGDMNFLPYSAIYRLLTEGSFRYEGCCSKTLEKESYYGTILGKTLLPDSLQITDTCQHWGILCKRMIEKMDHKREIRLLKIHNSDHQNHLNLSSKGNIVEAASELERQSTETGCSRLSAVPELSFGTGKLSHPFHFRSVYKHGKENGSKREVTTNQNDWVTVDYIFYSVGWSIENQKQIEDELKLVARYKLLTSNEAEKLGPIPNFASPSDHYPLLATFLLET